MNKKIASLLISFLILLPIFAASKFGGEARLSFGIIHRDDKGQAVWDFGFLNTSEANFKMVIDENIRETSAENGVYAEVKAHADVRIKAGAFPIVTHTSWKEVPPKFFKFKIYLDYFNIVFDKDRNFKLSLMGSLAETRYAKGWQVEEDYGNTIGTSPFISKSALLTNESVKGSAQPSNGWIPGLALIYGKFSLSLGIDGGYGNHITNDWGQNYNKNNYSSHNIGIILLAAADDIYLTDAIALSGTFGFVQSSDFMSLGRQLGAQRHLVFGGKAAITLGDFLFNIGGNGNLALIMQNQYTDVWQPYSLELSGQMAYKVVLPVSIDVWYLDNWALWTAGDKPLFCTYDNKDDLGFVYRDINGNFLKSNKSFLHQALSARLKVQPLPLFGITLRLEDIINQFIVGIDLPFNVTSSLVITPSFEYTNNTSKKFIMGYWIGLTNKNSITEGKLTTKYTAECFTIDGGIRIGKESLMRGFYVKPLFSISSDKLIKNLMLKFKWKGATFSSEQNGTAPSGKSHTGTDFGEFMFEAGVKF